MPVITRRNLSRRNARASCLSGVANSLAAASATDLLGSSFISSLADEELEFELGILKYSVTYKYKMSKRQALSENNNKSPAWSGRRAFVCCCRWRCDCLRAKFKNRQKFINKIHWLHDLEESLFKDKLLINTSLLMLWSIWWSSIEQLVKRLFFKVWEIIKLIVLNRYNKRKKYKLKVINFLTRKKT